MRVLSAVLVMALLPAAAAAETSSVLSLEIVGLVAHSSWEGWSAERTLSQANAAGFEYFAKVSGERGDVLTADLQMRVSYDPARPDGELWAIEVHNAWIEHKLGLGRNLRLGHFEPAFGLERSLDTHGTLLQTLAMEAIGFKHDWGLGYRGEIGGFDAEAALQLGSGMGIERRGGSYLASARASTPPGAAFRVGVSAVHGRTLESMGMSTIPQPRYAPDPLDRTLLGADAEWNAGVIGLALDAALGRVGDAGAGGALVQASVPLPGVDNLALEGQVQAWWDEGIGADPARLAVVSASWRATPGWTLRAAVAHDAPPGDAPAETLLVLQAYYYGRPS